MTNTKLTAMEREALRWQQEGGRRLGEHLTETPAPPILHAHGASERLQRAFRAILKLPHTLRGGRDRAS
jgi:hypothetical protein